VKQRSAYVSFANHPVCHLEFLVVTLHLYYTLRAFVHMCAKLCKLQLHYKFWLLSCCVVCESVCRLCVCDAGVL